MMDLMQVVKEAKEHLLLFLEDKKDSLLPENVENGEKLKEFLLSVTNSIMPFHEKVKDQVSLEYFSQLIVSDMQHNFIGGGLISADGDTEIKINKPNQQQ